MRKDRLEKENLENIGRSLLTAGALREAEIEKIAAREDLFAGVLVKVNSAPGPAPKEAFSFARFIRRHELGIGGAMAAVLCFGIFGLYLQQKSQVDVSGNVKDPAVDQSAVARPEFAPQVNVVNGITPGRAQDLPRAPDRTVDEPVAAPAAERAVYRQPRPAAPVQPERIKAQPQREKEFYPVTYAGENGELARGGRVIRVDVARSTLFAMGINVPLENESPTVKADLLVGPDGVTRAIRLVE